MMSRVTLIFLLTLLAAQWGAVAQEAEPATSTLEDQKDVAVTIYNNNRALVRDRRTITLGEGEIALRFMDVAQQIQPETVSLKSLTHPDQLGILEQNYEYDLMSPQKMLEKYVGKNVRLINQNNDLNFIEVEAKLLSLNEGPVYEINGEIYLGHPGNVVLPDIPNDLIAKPTLVWLLQNGAAEQELEATYLTGGMSWKADYVLNVNEDTTKMNLDGWVTLNNQSGATYTDAQLKLVAGEVNIVQPEYNMMAKAGRAPMAEMAMADSMMQEESFAEYHLYTLPRRTTIKQNASKQVSLLNAADIAVTKIYEYRGDLSFYSQQMGYLKDQRVDVFLSFQNKEDNGLGIPLPGGIMRVYQQDKGGSPQFAGEDRLKHTPKNEEVKLKMGQAFDVVAERTQKDFKITGSSLYECEFEILIRNHKEEDIVVDVVEPMPSDWKILTSSMEYEKKDAQSAIFHVPVKKDEEAKITYRVQVRY